MKNTTTVAMFAGSLVAGCLAAVAIASSAGVDARPVPHAAPAKAAPEVVRLDPVVVTVSKTYFDAVRQDAATEIARTNEAREVSRG